MIAEGISSVVPLSELLPTPLLFLNLAPSTLLPHSLSELQTREYHQRYSEDLQVTMHMLEKRTQMHKRKEPFDQLSTPPQKLSQSMPQRPRIPLLKQLDLGPETLALEAGTETQIVLPLSLTTASTLVTCCSTLTKRILRRNSSTSEPLPMSELLEMLEV